VIHSHFSLRWAIRACTCWSNITVNFGIWVLEINCEHPMVEALWVIHKFSAVLLKSPYNHKSGSRSEWVEGLFIYLSFSRLLYLGILERKNKFIKFKEIITYEKSGWKPTYHKVLSSAIHELLHLFFVIITSYMHFKKSSIRFGSCPRTIVCKKKNYCQLNIFIKNN
jgi:hypothetical protein